MRIPAPPGSVRTLDARPYGHLPLPRITASGESGFRSAVSKPLLGIRRPSRCEHDRKLGCGTPSRRAGPRLGAVVLLVLLALLHAMFSPGSSHLSGLHSDGCLPVTTASTYDYETVTPEVVTGADVEGGQGGDASPSCDASGYGPRQLGRVSYTPAASVAACRVSTVLPASTMSHASLKLWSSCPPIGRSS